MGSGFMTIDKQVMTDIKSLCDHVRQTSYEIHFYHGHGHLEKVYENALAHCLRLSKQPSTQLDLRQSLSI